MKCGYSVQIPFGNRVILPGDCVICCGPVKDDVGRIVIENLLFHKHLKDVPFAIHERCAKKLRRDTWTRYMALLLAGGLASSVFYLYIDTSQWPYWYERALYTCFLVLVLLPFGIRQMRTPLPLECSVEGSQFVFRFRSRAYAAKFAQLNHARVDGWA